MLTSLATGSSISIWTRAYIRINTDTAIGASRPTRSFLTVLPLISFAAFTRGRLLKGIWMMVAIDVIVVLTCAPIHTPAFFDVVAFCKEQKVLRVKVSLSALRIPELSWKAVV